MLSVVAPGRPCYFFPPTNTLAYFAPTAIEENKKFKHCQIVVGVIKSFFFAEMYVNIDETSNTKKLTDFRKICIK